MTRLVSAEEARGLLARLAEPTGRGHARVVIRRAAPDLAATVIALSEERDENERRAWTRGFVNALAYHTDGGEDDEALGSAALYSAKEAVEAGAEQGDVDRIRARHGGCWPIRSKGGEVACG